MKKYIPLKYTFTSLIYIFTAIAFMFFNPLYLCEMISDHINETNSILSQFKKNYSFYSFFFGLDLVTLLLLIKDDFHNRKSSYITFIFLIQVSVLGTYIDSVEMAGKTIDKINVLWGFSMLAISSYGLYHPIKRRENAEKL